MSDPNSLRSQVTARLREHDNDDYKAQHVGYLDPKSIENGEFDRVTRALDSRMERDRYSLISMLLAGIYFGLLIGHNLFSTGSVEEILWWALPVLLVSIYAIVTASSICRRLAELAEAKALVRALDDRPRQNA